MLISNKFPSFISTLLLSSIARTLNSTLELVSLILQRACWCLANIYSSKQREWIPLTFSISACITLGSFVQFSRLLTFDNAEFTCKSEISMQHWAVIDIQIKALLSWILVTMNVEEGGRLRTSRCQTLTNSRLSTQSFKWSGKRKKIISILKKQQATP
jgi:hypothetical protein